MVLEFESIAPGRVNLIGEHIDYNDLSVLPMAVDREITLRFVPLDTARVCLSSPRAEFPTVEFSLDKAIVAEESGHWSNYVRAAAHGLLQAGYPLLRGLQASVQGTIPIASGMSSSSALVVASAQALLHANHLECDPLELAGLMASAERFVGVAGGGMDQAASLNGRAGHALRIDFKPLGCEPIPIPKGWGFCVASSLIRAEKSSGVKQAYNQRTVDCASALQQVWPLVCKDRSLEDATYGQLLGLHREGGPSPGELIEQAVDTLDETLAKRFRHVVGEAQRVHLAEAALRQADALSFGQLMLASHESLRTDYEVSLPELDELVALAMANGAYGARLTGAGFGGCAVILCPQVSLASLQSALARAYYEPRGIRGAQLGEVLFEVRASQGARVVTCD
jgi:galactokinase